MPRSLLRLAAVLLFATSLHAGEQTVRRADFEEKIEAWHLIDLDGDGRRELLAFFADEDAGKPYRVVKRPAKGPLVITPRGHLPADTVALALRRPKTGDARSLEAVLISPRAFAPARWTGEAFAIGATRPVKETPFFRAALSGPPPIWHWELDFDDDGHGDLMIPVDAGVCLARGQADGGIGPLRRVDLPGRRAITPGAPEAYRLTRTLPHPVFRDVDADGKADLAWFDGLGLGYARQLEQGAFAPAARFPLPWLGEAQGGTVEKTDVSMTDANGDGRSDLLLSRMRSNPERITQMKTTIVLLQNRGGDTPFARRPDQALVIPGVAGVGPTLLDCDGDGRDDLVVGSYGANAKDLVSKFLGGVPLEFQIFRGEGKGFAERPMASSKLGIGSDAFSDLGARHCARIMPDLDGDGVVDLVHMIPRGRRQVITLKPGTRGERLTFAKKPSASFTTKDFRAMSDIADTDDGVAELLLVGRSRLELLAFPR